MEFPGDVIRASLSETYSTGFALDGIRPSGKGLQAELRRFVFPRPRALNPYRHDPRNLCTPRAEFQTGYGAVFYPFGIRGIAWRL